MITIVSNTAETETETEDYLLLEATIVLSKSTEDARLRVLELPLDLQFEIVSLCARLDFDDCVKEITQTNDHLGRNARAQTRLCFADCVDEINERWCNTKKAKCIRDILTKVEAAAYDGEEDEFESIKQYIEHGFGKYNFRSGFITSLFSGVMNGTATFHELYKMGYTSHDVTITEHTHSSIEREYTYSFEHLESIRKAVHGFYPGIERVCYGALHCML